MTSSCLSCALGTRGLQGKGSEQPEYVAGCHRVTCSSVGKVARQPGLCRETHWNSFQRQAVQSGCVLMGTGPAWNTERGGSPGPGLGGRLSPGWGPAGNGAQTLSFRWVRGEAVFQIFRGQNHVKRFQPLKHLACIVIFFFNHSILKDFNSYFLYLSLVAK